MIGLRTAGRAGGGRLDEEGSATVEVAVLAPTFALLVGLVLLAGRVVLAGQVVETAAWDAARSASLVRDGDPTIRAQQVANGSLAAQDLRCAATTVTVDTSAWSTTAGTPSSVAVDVACELVLWDLPFGLWTHRVEASARAPGDTFSSRQVTP